MQMLNRNIQNVYFILQPHSVNELILYDLRRIIYFYLLNFRLPSGTVLKWTLSAFYDCVLWFVHDLLLF